MTEKIKLTGYPSIDKPWLKYYSEEAINAPLPKCTMYQYIWENNKDYLSDIALRYYGTRISYEKLFSNIKKAAAALYSLGIRAGDIVTVMSMHTPETIYAIYALNYIGAIANMVYMTLSEKEIVGTLENTESKLFLVLDVALDKVEAVKVKIHIPVIVIDCSYSMLPHMRIGYVLKTKPKKHTFLTWKAFLDKGQGEALLATDHIAPAVIVYTSGTTGEPKGVVLSNDNLNIVVFSLFLSGKDYKRRETALFILPPFFGFGIAMLHLVLRYGMNSRLWIELDPERIGVAFHNEKPNRFVGGPAIVDGFMKKVHGDMSYLHEFAGGGGSLTEEKERELNEFLHKHHSSVRYTVGYGMTEFASAVCMQQNHIYRFGSIGIPMVGSNIKVIDTENGQELTYNQTGELCFQTKGLMSSYFKNAEATNEIIKKDADGDRWIYTGDLGHIDEDGFVYFDGKIKRIFITTGQDGKTINKIFPQRIEELIEAQSGILQCGVIACNDPVRMNVPIAFYTAESLTVTPEKLEIICRETLPDHLWPEKIIYLKSMPLTPSGKIDYRALEKLSARNEA